MTKRIPVIHTIAVCENPKTKKRMICDIYERDGKITVEYKGETYDASLYSNDYKKVISLIFKLEFIRQYHFQEYGKIYEAVKFHNEKLKK